MSDELYLTKDHALHMARKQFANYAEQHKVKNTPEADDKAKTNERMAQIMERACNFDYVAETEVTASNVYNPQKCDTIALHAALRDFTIAARRLDQFKKLLFRQRSAEECGLPNPTEHSPRLSEFKNLHDDLVHGIIGACTEAGELAEIIETALTSTASYRVDKVNVKEEIGDLLWYLARLVKYCGTTFEDEQRRNIAKLRKRHGNAGFNREADIHRNLEAEREVLRNARAD